MDHLLACLPEALRGPATRLERIAAGQSGAGVYRVEAGERTYVLKVSGPAAPLADWRRQLELRRQAAAAGLAPGVVHADEAHRAVLSDFVADRSFPALYGNPATRTAAVALLGRTVRALHALPAPAGTPASDPRAFLGTVWAGLQGHALPTFATEAIRRALAEPVPEPSGPPVLSHNDLNPTNLTWDGERLLLLDWETAGLNDPSFDLASAAVFLRMDEPTCLALLGAYQGAPVGALPARFAYSRRLVAALCGAMFLDLARRGGHPGDAGATREATPGLGELYGLLRSGALSLGAPAGKWAMGLALLRSSLEA